MKLVKFNRTITQEFNGFALISNDSLIDVKYQIDSWCDDTLDEHCYMETTDLTFGKVSDLRDPEVRRWFEKDILPHNDGLIIMKNEDDEWDDELDSDMIEEMLDKAASDREYEEFMKNQLKLSGV